MTNYNYYVMEFQEGEPYIYYGPEVDSWFLFVEKIKKKAIRQLKKEEKEGLAYNDSNIKYRMDRLIKELGYKKQYDEMSKQLIEA